jgi:hypothetical protein
LSFGSAATPAPHKTAEPSARAKNRCAIRLIFFTFTKSYLTVKQEAAAYYFIAVLISSGAACPGREAAPGNWLAATLYGIISHP